jgi:hypothetical protein
MIRFASLLLCLLALPAAAQQPSPPGAKVYFIEPKDGATMSNPVRVVMGLRGMGVAPAGIEKENTGHHHLIVDTEFKDLDYSIPNDEQHRHFGGGQTEAEITLPPGSHTLYLLFADENHIPHKPPVMSEKIKITVK